MSRAQKCISQKENNILCDTLKMDRGGKKIQFQKTKYKIDGNIY